MPSGTDLILQVSVDQCTQHSEVQTSHGDTHLEEHRGDVSLEDFERWARAF